MKRSHALHAAASSTAALALAGLAMFAALVALAPFTPLAAEPLHYAVRVGDLDAVRRLIEQGADVNAVDENGSTPLLLAIFAANDGITDALIAGGSDVDQATDVDAGALRARGADIEADQRPRLTPLMLAVFLNNRATAERLLEAKADVNAAGDDGLKPLHLTGFNPDATLATLLLDRGADVNARNSEDTTPLHRAAARGNTAVADVLLTRGAEVNALDAAGRTPLDVAHTQPSTDVFRLLVSRGAVAMRQTVDANVDVEGINPRLAPLIEPSILDRIAPLGPRPLGIALDATARKLFWAEFATNSIRSANLDGSNAETIPSDDLRGPIGIAVDAVAGKLYWTCDAAYPRKIQRAGLDGAGISDVASGPTVNRPSAIAVDPASNGVYWTESLSGRIRRANLDGSDIEDILTSGISSVSDRPDAREFKALGIAVDAEHRKLYWTEMLDAQILRADLDGSNVETVVPAAAGLALPAGITVDRGHIYWADAGAAKIQRADLEGSGIEDVLTANDGLIEPYGLALDHDAGRLYWTDAGAGTISSATLDGEDRRTVFAPRAMATHSNDRTEPDSSLDQCSDTVMAAGTRYVWTTVTAIGTCLKKVDALKAVWRRQSDAARATSTCLPQFDRLAGGPEPSRTLEGELRGALERACGPALSGVLRARDAPLNALLAKRCDRNQGGREELDCVAAVFRDAAYTQVALRFRRAAEWLDEVRPFMAAARASSAATGLENALANLDMLRAALRAMTPEPATAVAAGAAPRVAGRWTISATGQTTSYAATRRNGDREWDAVPEDGALRSGAPTHFLDNGDGTITDVNTRLMWEKKCDGCGGLHDMGTQYVLEPEDDGTSVASWLAAVNAENGSGYAGHADWRLPTVKELQSLVDYERFNPAAARTFDGPLCGLGCSDLRSPECSCTAMTRHCSATPILGHPERVFGLGFHLGIIGDVRKTEGCAARAVRDV